MAMFEVYGKTGCARCECAQKKISHILTKTGHAGEVDLTYHDMDSIDGMAEGAFNDVHAVPTTIARDASGQPVARWDGLLPPSADVMAFLASHAGGA